MRISGGAARGIPLHVPPGDEVRPSTDSLRQAVFSSLGARIPDSRFLDLFAGSGAFGLEALSRGAASGAWVEQHPKAVACVRRNLTAVCKSLGRDETGLSVLACDVFAERVVAEAPPADLIFADPPFPDYPAILPRLFERLDVLTRGQPDALIVLKLPGNLEFSVPGWTCFKRLGSSHQPSAAFIRRS
jgi:16S rRNA (guanine966-N2)-methyltransferase